MVAAGAIVDCLLTVHGRRWAPDDAATGCRMMYQRCRDNPAESLSATVGARHVIAAGLADDLPVCTAVDSLDMVPEVLEKVILLSRSWSVIGSGPASGAPTPDAPAAGAAP
jgi:phosphosulfolactate phosphohydrolase-like enzyme